MNCLKFIRVYFNKNLAMDKQLSLTESLKSSKKKKKQKPNKKIVGQMSWKYKLSSIITGKYKGRVVRGY